MGTTSAVPEKHGSDFLFFSRHFKLAGVQRKELGDLVASVYDGRLGKELEQMKTLGLGVLLLEGRPAWTGDGLLMQSSGTWTLAQHLGTMWSVQSRGFWIATVERMDDTIQWLSSFERWLAREKPPGHGFRNRPKAKGEWGRASSIEWGMHLLQGFDGIGPDKAKAIIEHFNGIPLGWLIDPDELATVPGISLATAKKLIGSLIIGDKVR